MLAYNERTTIAEIIRRVLAVPLRIELIVVDDGSTSQLIHWAAFGASCPSTQSRWWPMSSTTRC
jgi:glycosyltransferase involved in cell wall biosynthesis